MPNPKVKFVVDPQEDIRNYLLFNKYRYGADDRETLKMFLPRELHYISESRFSEREKTKIVKEYVLDTFLLRQKEMIRNTDRVRKKWQKVSRYYFQLVKEIFKNRPWPKGKYIGFASVFDMYPKNVKAKTFYFSGLNKDVDFNVAIVAHEMLHFMFFDYLEKKIRPKNKKPEYIWNVSETFNLVMEGRKPYQKIFKTDGKPYYAAHAKMLVKMNKLWEEKEDIDFLLGHYFNM